MGFEEMKDNCPEKGILGLPECQEKIKQAKEFLEQVKSEFDEKKSMIESKKYLLEGFYQKGWDEGIYQTEVEGKINELEEYLKEDRTAALSFYKVEEIIKSLESQMEEIKKIVDSIKLEEEGKKEKMLSEDNKNL